MNPSLSAMRRRRRTVIDAAIIFLIILLMAQMWLLTATLEAFLAGHRDVTLPAMLVSAVLTLACVALSRFPARAERIRMRD